MITCAAMIVRFIHFDTHTVTNHCRNWAFLRIGCGSGRCTIGAAKAYEDEQSQRSRRNTKSRVRFSRKIRKQFRKHGFSSLPRRHPRSMMGAKLPERRQVLPRGLKWFYRFARPTLPTAAKFSPRTRCSTILPSAFTTLVRAYHRRPLQLNNLRAHTVRVARPAFSP